MSARCPLAVLDETIRAHESEIACHGQVYTDADALREVRAAVAGVIEAGKKFPSDIDMVEDNPDEGARYFCCGLPYQSAQYRHPSRPDPNKHASDCWYPQFRAALAKLGGAG